MTNKGRQRSTGASKCCFLNASAGPFSVHSVVSRTFPRGIHLWEFEKVQTTASGWRCAGSPAFVHPVCQELPAGFFTGHILPSGKYDVVLVPVLFRLTDEAAKHVCKSEALLVPRDSAPQPHRGETRHFKVPVRVFVCVLDTAVYDMLGTWLSWGFPVRRESPTASSLLISTRILRDAVAIQSRFSLGSLLSKRP